MYGTTNTASLRGKIESRSSKTHFVINKIKSDPFGVASEGTIAIKTSTEITNFYVLYVDIIPSLSVSGGIYLFERAEIGSVFFLYKLPTSSSTTSKDITLTGARYVIRLASGTHMYQKLSDTGNLTPVDAWMYCPQGWKSLNY